MNKSWRRSKGQPRMTNWQHWIRRSEDPNNTFKEIQISQGRIQINVKENRIDNQNEQSRDTDNNGHSRKRKLKSYLKGTQGAGEVKQFLFVTRHQSYSSSNWPFIISIYFRPASNRPRQLSSKISC